MPADLRHDWSIPLTAAGFDPDTPTAWSREGLLPYLTGAAQDALFTRIDALSATGSAIAIGALGSHFDPDAFAAVAASHPDVKIFRDVDFAALTYDPGQREDPADWLAAHRWSVGFRGTTLDLQAGYGLSVPEVDAAVDAVPRSSYLTATRRG